MMILFLREPITLNCRILQLQWLLLPLLLLLLLASVSTARGAEQPETFTALENYNSEGLQSAGVEQDQNNVNRIPLTQDYPLYCYPNYNSRKKYENVWGKYHLEVKESLGVCGPSDNFWDQETVSVNEAKDELTLQFKRVNNRWTGGEVRVLLPEAEMPYDYGEYSFSVKSIEVKDQATGQVVNNTLPKTVILGLFTWDATEDFASHENYNHEVDVEIARWDVEDVADVQYLVQPPGDPHKYRFYSGTENQTFHQAPHTYKFDWRPAEIEWNSDAGGGHQFMYTSQMAIDAGTPDYIQCMPADVEVRINLWHLFGDSQPEGMEQNQIVEVVLDDFQYTPNGLTGVHENGVCGKNCHCESYSCVDNRCVGNVRPLIPDEKPADFVDLKEPVADTDANTSANTDLPVSSALEQTAAVSNKEGGLNSTGKTVVTLFMLSLVVFAVVVYMEIRTRRHEANRDRIVLFDDDPTRTKAVVECIQNKTIKDSSRSLKTEAIEPSFELCLEA